MHTEVEPPGTFAAFPVFLHPIRLCTERRPCPPLPLEGPILLKMVPDVFHKRDRSSAVPTSLDLGNTAFSADLLEVDLLEAHLKATEPTTSTRLGQSPFLHEFSLLVVLSFTRRWVPDRFKWFFCNFLVMFLALVSVSYLLSAFSASHNLFINLSVPKELRRRSRFAFWPAEMLDIFQHGVVRMLLRPDYAHDGNRAYCCPILVGTWG
ncbi:hypothetical protein C8J57DRAFT_1511757 [Mycena rebaudengoi]|nr:hypothetical protein C8J57DRAFT_1511757 [Mycena rebaudengoi]